MNSRFNEEKTTNRMPQELDFCTALDQLVFSEETKARMAQRLESGVGASKRRPWRARRAAAVALAAVLAVTVLGVGAGAAGAFRPVTELFAPLFGGEESQLALIERLGTPIGVSDTRNGVTITAQAMLNDGKSLAVLYSVSRENGEPLVPAGQPEGNLVFGYHGGSGPWKFATRDSCFETYEPGEASAHYLALYTLRTDVSEPLIVDWNSLEYWQPESDGPVNILKLVEEKGDPSTNDDCWQIELPLLQSNAPSKELAGEGNQGFTANDRSFVITSVFVSPLSVEVAYTTQGETIGEEGLYDEEIAEAFTEGMSLLLRKKDGTELDLSELPDQFGNIHPTSRFDFSKEEGRIVGTCGAFLPEIIPLEEMDCVIFNGLEYPVNP